LWSGLLSPTDIITALFRAIKNYDIAEYLKLELLKVNLKSTYVLDCSDFIFHGQKFHVYLHRKQGLRTWESVWCWVIPSS
jgi:hypothetical protein